MTIGASNILLGIEVIDLSPTSAGGAIFDEGNHFKYITYDVTMFNLNIVNN